MYWCHVCSSVWCAAHTHAASVGRLMMSAVGAVEVAVAGTTTTHPLPLSCGGMSHVSSCHHYHHHNHNRCLCWLTIAAAGRPTM
jgi:hypothetical protein